ncbi:MAG: FmdB family zinc ribbon protein [Anaerolineae bacterium]
MPIYEYRCESCGATFDKFVRSMSTSSDEGSTTVGVECPECHGKHCRRNISRFGTVGASRGASSSACSPSGG